MLSHHCALHRSFPHSQPNAHKPFFIILVLILQIIRQNCIISPDSNKLITWRIGWILDFIFPLGFKSIQWVLLYYVSRLMPCMLQSVVLMEPTMRDMVCACTVSNKALNNRCCTALFTRHHMDDVLFKTPLPPSPKSLATCCLRPTLPLNYFHLDHLSWNFLLPCAQPSMTHEQRRMSRKRS